VSNQLPPQAWPPHPGPVRISAALAILVAPYEVRDPWQEALHHDGGTQMRHLKTLMLSRSYFDRVPDQSLVTAGTGRATRSESGSWAMVYLPEGGSVDVDASALASRSPQVTWFNPRTGESQPGQDATGGSYTAPDNADWVIVLDVDEDPTQ
jgi:Putative collagen-binding domain of a collagenase